MTKNAKPILDTETGKEYTSMYKAGQELATLVAGDPKNRLVWFAVQRAFPGRFQTKDLDTGSWVPLKAAARKARTPRLVASEGRGTDAVASTITAKDSTPSLPNASVATTRIASAPKKASTAKATKKQANTTTQSKSSGKKAKAATRSSRTRRIA